MDFLFESKKVDVRWIKIQKEHDGGVPSPHFDTMAKHGRGRVEKAVWVQLDQSLGRQHDIVALATYHNIERQLCLAGSSSRGRPHGRGRRRFGGL